MKKYNIQYTRKHNSLSTLVKHFLPGGLKKDALQTQTC